MSDKPQYLTREGLAKAREELAQLKGEKRQELSDRLRVAISQGDLSENADYINTKQEYGFVEGRILELENLIRNAVVIENNAKKGEVGLGTQVTIQEDDLEPEVYYMVGATEANPGAGRISNESPIGRALMGKKAGDKVRVDVPNGKIEFVILKVE